MSYAINTLPADDLQAQKRIPWLAFLFLLVVPFLLVQHTWDRVSDRSDDINASQEELLERVSEGHSIRRVAFLLLATFGIVGCLRSGSFELKIGSALSWLVVLLAAWTFASVLWTDTVWLTVKRLIVFSAMCLGAAAVSKRFSLRDLRWWIFLSSLTYLLIGISAEITHGVFQPLASDQRFSGTLHPNHQGVNCGLLVLSGIACAVAARQRQIWLGAGAALGLLFLVFTQSRTSFVSTLVALFVFWMLFLRPGRRLVLLGAVLMIGCLVLLLGDVAEPILHKAAHLNRQEADTSRIPIWQESLSYLEDRSLTGYGYQAFWTERRIDEISASQDWGVGEAHSSYVTMLLELGLIGACLFVLILIGSLLSTISRFQATRNLGYAFLAALLVFSMLHGILESSAVLPTFQSFITMIAVTHLAFVRSAGATREGLES